MITSNEARSLYHFVDRIKADHPSEADLLHRLIADGEAMRSILNWLRDGNSVSIEPLGPIEPKGTSVVVVVTQVDQKGDRENDRLRAMRISVQDANSVPQLLAAEIKKLVEQPFVEPASPLRQYQGLPPIENLGSW